MLVDNQSEYVYKELQLNDVDQYVDLYQSCNSVMDLEKKEPLDIWANMFIKRLSSPNSTAYGCFNSDNKLIATLSGIFPSDTTFWFSRDLIIDDNLNLGHYDALLMSLNLFNPLIEKAEARGQYWYYSRKSVRQQLLWEKIVARAKQKMIKENTLHLYKMMQYDAHYEAIYRAGEPCRYKMHEFFFKGNTFNTDTMIIMHSVNLEDSKKLLNLI